MSNQYKDLVAYDKDKKVSLLQVTEIKNVAEHANGLQIGYLPTSLLENSLRDSNFRDAVLNHLVNADPGQSLKVLTRTISSCSPDDSNLTLLCEYGAAIAYAYDKTDLAKAIVLRTPSTTPSSLIKNIAVGLANGMKAETFKGLLQSSTAMSASLMQN